MNYLNIYKNLMQKRVKQPSTQQYTEKHHILPRSIKNNNTVVLLSAREHFIAHALLVKITQKRGNKIHYYKMLHAFNNMKANRSNKRYVNSHLYELFRKKYSEARSYVSTYVTNPTKDKIWITNLELKENKLINKDQQLPQGWLYGRITNFELYLKRYNDALTEQNLGHFINYQEDMNNKIKPRILLNNKNRTFKNKKQKQAKIDLVNQYFEEYKINGYKGVVQKFNYTSSQEALCQTFNAFKKQEYYQYKILHKKIKPL